MFLNNWKNIFTAFVGNLQVQLYEDFAKSRAKCDVDETVSSAALSETENQSLKLLVMCIPGTYYSPLFKCWRMLFQYSNVYMKHWNMDLSNFFSFIYIHSENR